VPLSDFRITNRTQRRKLSKPSRPIVTKCRVFLTPALAAAKNSHRCNVLACQVAYRPIAHQIIFWVIKASRPHVTAFATADASQRTPARGSGILECPVPVAARAYTLSRMSVTASSNDPDGLARARVDRPHRCCDTPGLRAPLRRGSLLSGAGHACRRDGNSGCLVNITIIIPDEFSICPRFAGAGVIFLERGTLVTRLDAHPLA
jgi:hypothetical protein